MAIEGEESLPLTITDLRSYFDLKPVRVKRRVSLFPLLGLLLLYVRIGLSVLFHARQIALNVIFKKRYEQKQIKIKLMR